MNSRTINQQLMLFMIKHLLWVKKTENQVLLLKDFPQLTEDTKSCVRWPRSGSRECGAMDHRERENVGHHGARQGYRGL